MSVKVQVEIQDLVVETTGPPEIRNCRKIRVDIGFPCQCGTNTLKVTSADFPMED